MISGEESDLPASYTIANHLLKAPGVSLEVQGIVSKVQQVRITDHSMSNGSTLGGTDCT